MLSVLYRQELSYINNFQSISSNSNSLKLVSAGSQAKYEICVYTVHFVQGADYDPQLIVATDILIIKIVKMYRNGLTIVLYP